MLTREDGHLNVTRMSALVDQLAWLRRHDHEVILVSSGAVMAGRGELQIDHQLSNERITYIFSAKTSEKEKKTSFYLDKADLDRKTLNMENIEKVMELCR